MKKVICFDCWTVGVSHFERHTLEFEKAGYEMVLVHYGSWGHDKGRAIEERIGNLIVRDISFYSNSLLKVFRVEKPVVVLFLSTRSFINMAFNRYALFLGIPTGLIYHGLVSVQDVSNIGKKAVYSFSRLNYFRMIINRSEKNLFINIPNYLHALIYTKAEIKVFKDFLQQIKERITGRWSYDYLYDSQTTFGCVYSNVDVSHMLRFYNVEKSKIYVIGNPDLLNFNIKTDDVLCCVGKKNYPLQQVIYVETGFNSHGIVYSNDTDFVQNMVAFKAVLSKVRVELKLKLHPVNLQNKKLLQDLNDAGIELVSNSNFIFELKRSIAAICEPSSALLVPCILGLPVFLNNIGVMHSISFGDMVFSYPGSQIVRNFEDLCYLIAVENIIKIEKYKDWIELNIGTIPPNDISKKVLKAVEDNICL